MKKKFKKNQKHMSDLKTIKIYINYLNDKTPESLKFVIVT